MSNAKTHPRRRAYKDPTPHSSTPSTHRMQLRKSCTFASPKSPSPEACDLSDLLTHLPRRSPTSVEDLEDLIDDANVQHIATILSDIEKKLPGSGYRRQSSCAGGSILRDRDVLPVPDFMLRNTGFDRMDIDSKPTTEEHNSHDHASDSGLGSSVSGSENISRSSSVESTSTTATSTRSAITQSFSTLGAHEAKPLLGDHACKAINDGIIQPILAEESLKDFHPLIKDVPRRIGEKNISNLRDLEKTLIFLAPVSGIRYLSESAKAHCILRGFKEFSATPSSYLRFCERSIQLLHATVDSLSDQDQRLPTDRPYTTNYFLDLLEQIRRYAAIMAATRQKESKGEELDEMDYSPDEKITLRGGLSHDGRPAELVREKNGKVLPIAEGADDIETGFSSKRTLSDDETDDEGVKRSMARRRKSDKPGDVLHMCRDCKKEFKRPCDLTKHEKTHSRPWKCSEEKCKYYDLGWPTEKERDRHMNDKHSAAPPQYKCLYPPCTYASKRESNCKQHMEKAHGWEYVRSKSNGRKKAPTVGSECSPSTPLTPAFNTPATQLYPSPQLAIGGDFEYPYGLGTPALTTHDYQGELRRDSFATDGSAFTYSSGPSPTELNYSEDAVTPEDITINDNLFNCALNNNLNVAYQQQTPLSTTFDNFDTMDFSRPFGLNTTVTAGIPHLSPGAQADVTLFSPQQMQVDEGFSEGIFSRPMGDFQLFDQAQPSVDLSPNFFPEITQLGGQFDNNFFVEQQMPNTFDDLMNGSYQQ
ncbi:hypothetical protein EJ04DRAFT_568430 [Polyplosphaeria fusca]|uniref:C2H2-type domain-containing protein n=1 Tax=Polyplosphaeria fusca TaxID=682080 RepID=A0A9P4UYY4_9PLEO|nr:hypothetical protein EJ04DRAFT_568430 [Polyplosphaeria fusca]